MNEVRKSIQDLDKTRHQWLMPVILAIWEAEIRRIVVQGQLPHL
jgi:hypothetical protein